MMPTTKLVSTLIVILLLGACGSTPRSNYYMLSADARGMPGKSGPSLGIGPISIPEYLKAREMVLNRSSHKLELADFDRWAEPLDAGVQRVVGLNLAVLLQTQDVATYPWRRDSIPEYAVRITVVQFAAQGSEAKLVSEWAISNSRTGSVVGRRITEYTSGVSQSDPESVAAAYSELLLQLSNDIAQTIRSDRAANPSAPA